MKCPQCRRENQFPVPGLCPECYRQWKDDMRARYGPGPWPTQHAAVAKQNAQTLPNTKTLTSLEQAGCSSTAAIQQNLAAVVQRLQDPDTAGGELLNQLNTLLREFAWMLAHTAGTPETDVSESANIPQQCACSQVAVR